MLSPLRTWRSSPCRTVGSSRGVACQTVSAGAGEGPHSAPKRACSAALNMSILRPEGQIEMGASRCALPARSFSLIPAVPREDTIEADRFAALR